MTIFLKGLTICIAGTSRFTYKSNFGFPDQQSDATPATNAIEELSENDSQISSNKEVNKQVLEL